MRDPASVVRLLGNVATRAQLLGWGFAGFALTRAVRTGTLARIRRGYYATPEATEEQRVAVRIGGRLSCVTAASSYGLWGGSDERVHMIVPVNAARLRTAQSLVGHAHDAVRSDRHARPARLHWGVAANAGECWRSELADTLRQVVACADPETARAVLDMALQTRLVTGTELAAAGSVRGRRPR